MELTFKVNKGRVDLEVAIADQRFYEPNIQEYPSGGIIEGQIVYLQDTLLSVSDTQEITYKKRIPTKYRIQVQVIDDRIWVYTGTDIQTFPVESMTVELEQELRFNIKKTTREHETH